MQNVRRWEGTLIDVNYQHKEITLRLPSGLPLILPYHRGTKKDFIFAKFKMQQQVQVTFETGIGVTRIKH